MADIQQLIQKIVSDPKIATNSNFASKVYHDEPILFTLPQREKFTPPRFREMRKIGHGNLFDAKVFYEQGKFMEAFEDEYDYTGEFVQYFPTYQHMTDAQLRGYFSWRTRVRRGEIGKTSLSFAFVYLYELLNQIGVATPEEGFHALKTFWTAYREHDTRINAYVSLWLKDYVIYYNLDKSLLEGLADDTFDSAVAVLLDYKGYGRDEVFHALNALSAYNLEGSRFYKENPDDVKNVVCQVFSVISEYYNKNPKRSASDKFFGRICPSSYTLFKSAVFYPGFPHENRVYEMGTGHTYICENGVWSCERFFSYGHNNKHIGGILKTIDYCMRQSYGFKSTLQPGKTNKILREKIEKELAKYEQNKRDNAPLRIDIDVSKLHGIRQAALTTQGKLLVEEPGIGEPPDAIPAVASDNGTDTAAAITAAVETALSENEHRLLRCLLHGENYAPLLETPGVMLSVLVDGINEKLFDRFGDTVIVEQSGGPEVIEDYREELKGIVAS